MKPFYSHTKLSVDEARAELARQRQAAAEAQQQAAQYLDELDALGTPEALSTVEQALHDHLLALAETETERHIMANEAVASLEMVLAKKT